MTDLDNANIERCTASENFSILPNALLQDKDISMDAQGILTYLLSLPSDWKIKPKCIWKAKNIGRDRVYVAIEELIDLGYMCRVENKNGNLKSFTSYKAAYFKKYLRYPESQDTESQYPESQDVYKEIKEKRNNKQTTKDSSSQNPQKQSPSLQRQKEQKKKIGSSREVNPKIIAILEDLPINDATRKNLQRFPLEALTVAIKQTKERKPDNFGGYLFDRANNVLADMTSGKYVPEVDEKPIEELKNALQQVFHDVTLPSDTELLFKETALVFRHDNLVRAIVGYRDSDKIRKAQQILHYIKEVAKNESNKNTTK